MNLVLAIFIFYFLENAATLVVFYFLFFLYFFSAYDSTVYTLAKSSFEIECVRVGGCIVDYPTLFIIWWLVLRPSVI